jgi:hypothetical protein
MDAISLAGIFYSVRFTDVEVEEATGGKMMLDSFTG